MAVQPTHEAVSGVSPPFILIGLGPYAKSHYFKLFSKQDIFPKYIVDLDSKQQEIVNYLGDKTRTIGLYFVPEKEKDSASLPPSVASELLALLRRSGIRHAILATEPKAHLAYLKFFIENGIQVLVEKPLTSPPFSSWSPAAAQKIEDDYTLLLNSSGSVRIDLQCHRRYHPVYQFVIREMEQFLKEFDVPLTFCDIYHCDGMWNMPNEFLSRENHPYKYGYGKLMHSGYHFIDLLAWLIQTNQKFCSKSGDEAELYAASYTPTDFLGTLNESDYKRFFPSADYRPIFESPSQFGFDQFGELDFFSLLQLTRQKRKITTCSLNLLQTGFSRRAWSHLPEDTYKGNGRIRHERLNLQFGPLLNIQVHSYVAEEEKTSSFCSAPGSKNHFDVYLFRNTSLIGGKPFAHYRSEDFLAARDARSFNEISREKCFTNFLSGDPSLSSLEDQKLGIQILCHSLRALCKKNKKSAPIETFSIAR